MASDGIRKQAFIFLAVAGFLSFVLLLFPFVDQYVLSQVEEAQKPGTDMMVSSAWSFAMSFTLVVKVIVWMALVITFVRFFDFVIFRALRGSAQNEVSSLLRNAFSIVIYIIAFFIIFQHFYPNIQLAPLFTGSAILGIVVGLALQDTLGNLFAGIALQADQPFQIGDVILISSNRGTGVVEDVSWRGVKIRTFQNKLLIISNAVLGKETIKVARKEETNARLIYFSTSYHDSPAATKIAVREAIRSAENVSTKFRPIVRILKLGDNGIEWEVKYWLEDYARYNDTDALVRERIWYAFQREHITIPYPTRTLHVERNPITNSSEELFDMIAARLSNVPIFDPLSEDEIAILAEKVKKRVYSQGELIVRQGVEGNSMFVIDRGRVAIQVNENGTKVKVSELGESDFFGEMSLLTGEPRTADVVALAETEVMQIRRGSLKPILEANPLLAQSITDIVAERRAGLSASQEPNVADQAEVKKGMMRSIRKLFGLTKRKGETEE